MRKSTIVALVVLVLALVGMTVLLKVYTDQFAEEIKQAKAMTAAFAADLAPDSTIKLARVHGTSRYVVSDPGSIGLLLEARPSEASWRADPTGTVLARRLARHAFDAYPIDRPVDWVEFRLTRPDGTRVPEFGLRRGAGDGLLPVEAPAMGGGVPPR